MQSIDRRLFLKGAASFALLSASGMLFACSDGAAPAEGNSDAGQGADPNANQGPDTSTPITFVFLPDASSADMTASREAVAEAIKTACGHDAKIMTTTDYNVAIEAIAAGSAGMALLGAEGYVQANNKSKAVQACFTNSDTNGTLDEACYYSRICVQPQNVAAYQKGSGYDLTVLKDKVFSFVSATSTSGFKVPSKKIAGENGIEDATTLLESGSFFSEVLLGGSHQGSVVNLVSGDADAAAFDDIDVDMYLELISGEANMPGAVYQVRDDAEDPFTAVRGQQFVIISSIPVLNAPFCFNEEAVDEEARRQIVDYFCSSVVANDQRIFADPNDETAKTLYVRKTPEVCFLPVTDAWYDPIRRLS